jgi:hypothetical protein
MMGFGSAVAWVVFAITRYGSVLGYVWTFVLAVMLGVTVSVGVLGFIAFLLACLPWTVERLGLRRLGAWLRTRRDRNER